MSSHSTRSRNKMRTEDPEKYQRYLESQKKRSADYRQKMRNAKENPTKEDEEKRKNHLKKQRERMKRYLERKKKQKSATATQSVPEVNANSSNSDQGPDDFVSSTTNNTNELHQEREDMVTSNVRMSQESGDMATPSVRMSQESGDMATPSVRMSQESGDTRAQNVQHSEDSTDEGFLKIDTENMSHLHDEVLVRGNSSHEDMQVEEREIPRDTGNLNNVLSGAPDSENLSQNRQPEERGILDLMDTSNRNQNTQSQGRYESNNCNDDSVGHVYDFSPQSQIFLQEVQMSIQKAVNTQDEGNPTRAIFDAHSSGSVPRPDTQNLQSHSSIIRPALNVNNGQGLQLQNSIAHKTILNLDTRQPFDDQGEASRDYIMAARSPTVNDRPKLLPSLESSSLPIYRLTDLGNPPRDQTTFGNVPTAAGFHTLSSPPLDLSGPGSLLFTTNVEPRQFYQNYSNSSTQQMLPLEEYNLPIASTNGIACQPNGGSRPLNSIAAANRPSPDISFDQLSAHDRILDSIADPSRQGPTPHKRYLSQQPRNTSLAPTDTGLCTKHPEENIRVWCADCDQLLCAMCLPQHRRHAVSLYRVLQQGEVMQEIEFSFTDNVDTMLLTDSVFYVRNEGYITTYNKITGETDEIQSVAKGIFCMCLSPDNNSVWYCTVSDEVYQYDIQNKTHHQCDITGVILGMCVTRRGVVLGVRRRGDDSDDSDTDSDTDSDSDDGTLKFYLELYSKKDSYKTCTKSVCIYGKRSLKYRVIPHLIKECPVTGDLIVADLGDDDGGFGDDDGRCGHTVLLTDELFNTKYWFRGKTVTNKHKERKRTGYRNRLDIWDIRFDKEGNILILNHNDDAVLLIDHDTGRHIRTVYRYQGDGELRAMCIQDNGLLWCCINMSSRKHNILKSIKYMGKL